MFFYVGEGTQSHRLNNNTLEINLKETRQNKTKTIKTCRDVSESGGSRSKLHRARQLCLFKLRKIARVGNLEKRLRIG